MSIWRLPDAWLAPDRSSQVAQFHVYVSVGGVRIKVKFNRYENVHIYDDGFNRCCGRIGWHEIDCGVANKRQRQHIPPPQPALQRPAHEAAMRRALAEAVCEACAPEIDADGMLMLERAQPRLCNAWIHRVTGCREGRCKWFPCVADRVQHPRAAELRALHGI